MKISFRLGHKNYPKLSDFRQSCLAHDSVGGHLGRTQLERLPSAPQHAGRSPVPLPFPNPACTSGSSRFTYCWNLAWRILSSTLLAREMSTTVQQLEHPVALGSLACCRPWGRKESDRTQGLNNTMLAERTLPLRLAGLFARDWLGVTATDLAVGWDRSPSTSLSFQLPQVASSGFLTWWLGSKTVKADATKAFEALTLNPPSITSPAF